MVQRLDRRGDLFAEGGASAIGARLHRRHVEVELVSDLRLGIAVGEAHAEDRAVLVAEGGEPLAGEGQDLVRRRLVLWRRASSCEVGGQVARIATVAKLGGGEGRTRAALLSEVHEGGGGRHAIKPRGETRIATEAGAVTV